MKRYKVRGKINSQTIIDQLDQLDAIGRDEKVELHIEGEVGIVTASSAIANIIFAEEHWH